MPAKSGIARFKLVISATREGTELYPSVEDLPQDKRKVAKEALDGELAATLLIADRAGLRRMRHLLSQSNNARKPAGKSIRITRQAAVGFLVSGLFLLVLLVWAYLSGRAS